MTMQMPEPPFSDENPSTVLRWAAIGAGSLVAVGLLSRLMGRGAATDITASVLEERMRGDA
jgi:hypothetical protein